jgi:hypothetical protein
MSERCGKPGVKTADMGVRTHASLSPVFALGLILLAIVLLPGFSLIFAQETAAVEGHPGVWQEFENGGWYAESKESAQASGGRFVSLDQPGRAVYVTFTLEQPMRAAVLFIRYSRPGSGSSVEVRFNRNSDSPENAEALALLATSSTGGEQTFRWISHPVGNLRAGTHTLVVACTAAGGGANLDVAGLVEDDPQSRWMPSDTVENGRLTGTGARLSSARPSSVYDPRAAPVAPTRTDRQAKKPAEQPRRPTARFSGPQIIQRADEIKNRGRKLRYSMTWFGNDMAVGPNVPHDSGHTPHNVATIFVTPEGTLFTNVPWEEHGANVAEFKDGKWVNDARVGNHGGGRHVTANSKYVFFQGNRHRSGNPGIDRRDRSDISRESANRHVDLNHIVGLTCSEDEVFAAVHDMGAELCAIEILTTDLRRKARIDLPEVGLLTRDPQGHLWVLQRESGKIIRLQTDGLQLPQSISLPEDVEPTAIAADAAGRLLVADGGPSEQVLIYHNIDTRPELDKRFGEEGGLYASGEIGAFGPQRFVRLVGVGGDRNGNIYTASRTCNNGGTLLHCHAPDGKLLWQRKCQVWIDLADLHPDDPNLAFSTSTRMRVNWDAVPGNSNQWTAEALTIHHRKFPFEYRSKRGGSGSTFIRRLSNGQMYQYVIDMLGKDVHIYRFDSENHGAIAIPAGLVSEERIWVDFDGDGLESGDEYTRKEREITVGHFVDSEGTIWNASHGQGIFRYPIQGFTEQGVPIYSVENREVYPAPEGMGDLRRVYFFPEHGRTLLVNGFTKEHANIKHHWKRAGKVIRRFDNWQPDQWNPRWQLVPAYEDRHGGNDGDANIMSFDVAGDYLFIAREGGSREMGVRRGHVDVFRFDTGTYVGWMEPTPEIGHVGIMDITHGMRAFKRDNGEYLIFIEDSGKARILVYKWRP